MMSGRQSPTGADNSLAPGLSEFRAGWAILAGATAAVSTGGALYNYTASYFIKPLQQDFGWSRAEIGTGSMIMALTSAVVLPAIGHLTDRLGPLRVGGIGLGGYGLLLLLLSLMPGQLGVYYAIMFSLALTFAASTAVTFSPLVARHFTRRRGLALGIAMSGPAILLIPASPLLTALIAQASWRAGYAALGLGALLIGLPGLLIASRGSAPVGPKAKSSSPGLAFRDVVGRSAYWKLVFGTICVATALGGFLNQYAPMLADKKFTGTQIGFLGSVFVAMVLIGRTSVGALLDQLHPSRVAMTSMLGAAAGALLMLVSDPSFALAALFLALIGSAFGAEGDIQAFFTARQFGLRCFSTVFGTLAMLNAVGVGGGALFFGWIYDTYGNYDAAIYVAATALSIGALIFGSLPREPLPVPALPNRPDEPITA